MKLKDILQTIPDAKEIEKAGINDTRLAATSGKNIKSVVIGSVKDNPIPARYDPDNRIFYPVFKG